MVSARIVFGFSGHLASSTTDLKCMVIVPGVGKSFFTFLYWRKSRLLTPIGVLTM